MSLFKKKSVKQKAADQVTETAGTISDAANVLFGKVAKAAQESIDWAAPRVEAVADRVVPVAQEAAKKARPYIDEAAEKASDYAHEAIEKARPYVDDAAARYAETSTKVREDYLPRAKAAAAVAVAEAKKSDGDLASRTKAVTEAAKKELAKPQKKNKKGKVFGLTLLLGSALAAAYVAWARSKPVEDPWAEAYWEDVAAPTEKANETATEAPGEEAAVAEVPVEENAEPTVIATEEPAKSEEKSVPTPLDVAENFDSNSVENNDK